MQNDPHAPFSPLGLSLGALEDAFQRAHAYARATSPHDGTAGPTPCSHAEPSADVDPEDERLLDGAELLRAAREPIEWLLTLAHRLAAGEPEEVAAVDRLRAAFHARLAGREIGVRMSDVLIAFALLVGALDPGIVVEGVTRTIADGVRTLLTYEGVAIAAQLARIADRLPGIAVHHARRSRSRRSRTAPATAL